MDKIYNLLKYNLVIHDEPKILFEPKILWRFLLKNKFLPDNGFFDLRPIDIYQEYKKYVKDYNLQMVSLTKNLDSFFHLEKLERYQYFCYNIKDIEPNEFKKSIGQFYKDYQKNNKYSTPSGFKKNDPIITNIKSKIDIVLDDIETSKFRQIYTLENQANVFIHKTPSINLYISTLNEIELYEYLSILNELIENFKPENQNQSKDLKKTPHQSEMKHPFKDSETFELFNYILDKWSNTNDNKWGYIWEFFFTRGYGKITNKTEYESYIRTNHNFTKGKPNYDSCNSDKRYKELISLYDEFKEI